MRAYRCLKFPNKPFYITTPIFYVNAAPHIGHLYSMVLADTVSRWKAFFNPSAGSFFTTGTDEHGMKVQQAAAKAGFKDPKPFVDDAANKFLNLADKANIKYNRFIRTTDSDHHHSSKTLWSTLQQKGFIYKGKHSGWYSVSDESFYPETQLERNPLGEYVSKETGKPVEWFEEDNYFFALSKIQPQLLKFLQENKTFVIPQDKYNFIYNEVKEGLTDLSISRPRTRCSWGVPVPGDNSQVMYVWLEALANYITSAGYPDDSESFSLIWPADAHVVGKDIQRFHAIYWPAFLLAAGLKPPKRVVVHSHWTISGSKMSKSMGNVADPIEAMNKFGMESVKFFLQYDGYIDHDTPYSADRIASRHNVELVNKYGNLIMRICGPKFHISRAIAGPLTLSSQDIIDRCNGLTEIVDSFVSEFDTSRALQAVWSLIADTNQYIQLMEPWAQEQEEQDAIIRDAAEVARISSILLTPFLPELAARVLDRMSVDPENRTIDFAVYGADKTYGKGANTKGNPPIQPLPVD